MPLIDPLVATFNEGRAPTSRKYVAEQGIAMPNWSKTFQNFWSYSLIFALEKQPKNLNFYNFFISKRVVVGYFEGNDHCFKTIVLNDPNFESEESFLLDQGTSSTLTHELNLDPYSNFENIRSKNPNRLITAQLNINSLRYKFDSLVEILPSNVDILLISETKIDSSFPTAQFKIEGYTTFRLDRNSNVGGILLYVREDIPSTLLNTELLIEGFYIEINIRKKKWLLICTYNPNKYLI